MSLTPFFSGEIQLAGWSESHNSGSKISFWLPDAKDLDAFRVATIRKGNKAGQRFACVLVEIGDDEQLVQPIVPFVDKPKGGELAKWAGIMSNDPVFWEWLDQSGYAFPFGLAANSLVRATWLIRNECGVDSRAELDHNPEAAKIFRNMMGQFDEWKNGGAAA